ncbi:cobaltochelatase subunit CobN [Deinococcus peraridilitoris]|uniref:Mg chelatase, cobalamin biosynthesis protein CobN n=1 Tax=Deinococcus peraridilitoris (strain DSM 19664 / LMG 22246 / CIP 109416 / KR-200) TaxID=937777 RepID=L0A2X0_DEIPD|nr:cobaltochelatase subunit CobN [Deinococcus peraridilitoris]AFZ67794.1 Mg chelatase, cobalamin biosynthesis protein CobN [Deinococcus peraridilitoris DSM 19664]
MKRQRVTRVDGKTINVVQRRGHLSYCYHGCCCGHVKRGYAAVPVDVYKDEWIRRKLRNRVHLTKSGCLGPCTLANVAQLLFDGHSVWFHSVNDAWQVRAIYDYVEAMLAADRFLPPPPELLEYTFNYYTWDGREEGGAAKVAPEADASPEALSGIAFLTHADTDLLCLDAARDSFPPEFPLVTGVSLSGIRSDAQMQQLLSGAVGGAEIVVARIHGRLSGVPGYGLLLDHARRAGQRLLLLSGTGESDPELAASSSAPPRVQQDALAYLQAGGWQNIRELLCFLSDSLRLTGFGFAPPLALPEHGLYHPDLPEHATLEDWSRLARPERPTAGLTFYRAHALSGNTAFVDALVRALDDAGLNALPVFTTSLKATHEGQPAVFQFLQDSGGTPLVDVLINTLSFAMGEVNAGGVTNAGWSVGALERLGVPVLQAVTSGGARGPWETSARGLNPLDTAMNVALPEFDGRIISVPVSFKERDQDGARFVPDLERCARVAGQARGLARLRWLANSEKRIAFVFTNSASKASQIGNAVGLDAPASLLALLQALRAHEYDVGELPATPDALIHELIDRCAYDQLYLTPAQLGRAAGQVSVERYGEWFAELPPTLQRRMVKQWGEAPGEAYVHGAQLAFAGLELGNAFVALQPPRGYGMDPDAIYHTPELPPTHHYYALYRWLRESPEEGGWGADAIVHVGKHGTLEWLPGKGVGLSANCFPDALLGDLPLFYPFILSDPGEGTQAKRRAHAVVIDHLPPPLTRADTYGPLAELAALVDEYYQLELLDPAKLPLLQGQIWALVQQTNLGSDLGLDLGQVLRRDHGDHVHEWDDEFTPEGVPVTLAEMRGDEVAHLLEDIDGYLCEIGAAQIRDGLHVLGQVPAGEHLPEMLRALTRLANLDVPGVGSEIARLLGLDHGALLERPGARLAETSPELNNLAGRALFTHADVLELIDELALHLYQLLQRETFDAARIPAVLTEVFGAREEWGGLPRTLDFVCAQLKPNLDATSAEIDHLLHGLAGEYVPAGPSGAPSRGMAHILPTGRNFYAVDPRALPSQAAWQVGESLAREVLARFLRESGQYPENVSISVWGTSAMRTQGDDVAEILALLGARPTWHPQSRRVDGVELVPLAELGRPRIDVTARISGFFRDAFPHLIQLLDDAVQLAMHADEPPEQNYPRKHYLDDLATRLADLPPEEAQARASYRIFGSAPGAYGAGILPLIQEGNWQGDEDFTRAYVNWGGFAYTAGESGVDARDDFRERLAHTQVALHNQDNREHDLFDSDDYLQFFGGMIASIRSLSGAQPRHYFGDTQNPERARVRDLQEEALRVYRSRVVNPKWLEGIKRHGYKGGLELTATVDYLFGFDATAQVAHDFMYEGVAQEYALNPDTQDFLRESNPWALNAITDRLLEANARGMWAPQEETLRQLQQLHLDSEAWLEARGEAGRRAPVSPTLGGER